MRTTQDSALHQEISKSFEKINSLVREWFLLNRKKMGLAGFGYGIKYYPHKRSSHPVLQFFVPQKIDSSLLANGQRIPDLLFGLKTQVIESGHVRSLSAIGNSKTAQFGESAAHPGVPAGTMGAPVYRYSSANRETAPAVFLLSNNHVFANYNKATKGDPILQPGRADWGRSPGDIVGHLIDWVPIIFETDVSLDAKQNKVDAAIAIPEVGTLVSEHMPKIGKISSWRPIDDISIDLSVMKIGRTTGFTQNKIISVHASYVVDFIGIGTAFFEDQLICSYLGNGGDSGSLVLASEDSSAVGLLFARSDKVTIVNYIEHIQDLLNVTTSPTTWRRPIE